MYRERTYEGRMTSGKILWSLSVSWGRVLLCIATYCTYLCIVMYVFFCYMYIMYIHDFVLVFARK